MKRKFLSAVLSVTLAVCLFGNTVFASELGIGSTDVPEVTVETEESSEESGEANEETGESSEESSESGEETSEEPAEASEESGEVSEEAVESSEAPSEESNAASEGSGAATEFSEESATQTVEEEIGESAGLTYTVEGDTVTITGEGECWTEGSELQTAIRNAKHVVFRDCKIQGSMSEAFFGCSNLESINLSGLDTSEVTGMYDMFWGCSELTSLEICGINTSQVTDMGRMFYGCSNLKNLDVSNLDTSRVTCMVLMFYGCKSLKTLDLSSFDLSNVSVDYMLRGCMLQELRTPKVLPAGCSIALDKRYKNPDGVKTEVLTPEFAGTTLTALELTYTVEGDTVIITAEGDCWTKESELQNAINNAKHVVFKDCSIRGSMANAFNDCSNLQSIDLSGLDTSEVTNMSYMFSDCTSLTNLDVSALNTSQVTDMDGMFSNCTSLTNLDVSALNTSQVTDMDSMFYRCSNLTNLDVSNLDTSRVTYMSFMFYGCKSLKTLDLSSFDLSKVSVGYMGLQDMFSDCMLQELRTPKVLPAGCSIALGKRYKNPDGVKTEVLTPEFAGTTLMVVELKYTVEGDTVIITAEGDCWTNESELQTAIKNAKHVVFKDCKIQGSMGNAFYECSNLQSIDLSGLDTSEVINMEGMFRGCSGLTSLNVSGFDTSHVTYMGYMFYNCTSLKTLDLSSFDLSNVTAGNVGLQDMLWGCAPQELRTPKVLPAGCSIALGKRYKNPDGVKTEVLTPEFVGTTLTAVELTYTVEGDTVIITAEGDCWTKESELQNAINNAKHVVFKDCRIRGSMANAFNGCSNLQSIDLSGLDTSEVTDMGYMFYNCSNLASLDVSGFNTSQVTSMGRMFGGCSNLTSLNVSNFDTSQVTDMGYMFYNCTNLKTLDLSSFDLGNVSASDMGLRHMLMGCALQELRTPKVLPAGCSIALGKRYKNPDGVKTEVLTPELAGTTLMVVELKYTVEGDTVIITAEGDRWTNESELQTAIKNAKHVVFKDCKIQGSMAYAFYDCSNLQSIDLSGLDTSEVTDMSSMFRECDNLTSLDVSGFDTSRVTDMALMFYNCSSLTSLDVSGLDTSRVTDMDSMFSGCTSLKTLDLSSFDLSKVPVGDMRFRHMLSRCMLQELRTPKVLPAGCSIALGKRYKNPDGVKTEVLTPEFAGTTLMVVELKYTVEGDTVIITAEGDCWTKESELQTAIKNAKHVVFKDGKIQGSMAYAFYDCSNLQSIDLSGLDTSEVTDMGYMFYNCSNLTSLDVSGLNTSQVTSMGGMFSGCSNLTSLNVSGFDTSKVTDMGYMFYNCSNLASLDVSGFNTSQVTNMGCMFGGCSNLTSLNVSGFDTSKVTDMGWMFYKCDNLASLDVSGFGTSQVTNMKCMFYNCSNLTSLDVSNFDTSQVTDMGWMFYYCSNLTSLDVSDFSTSKVTNMRSMFYNCNNLASLDVSGFDTSQVTNMKEMFSWCNNLTSLNVSGFDTSKVTDMNSMFNCCNNLTSLNVSGFDTSKVTDMGSMFSFSGGSKLTSLDVSGFDTSQVTNMRMMFSGCDNLTSLNVSGFDTSKVTDMGWMFSCCSNLTGLDVSGFDTSKVTDMSRMFGSCSNLTRLDVSGFDTSKVTDMGWMFCECSSLVGVDVSHFDTSQVTNMIEMFCGCESLTSLVMSSFDTSKVVDMSYMFSDCSSLTDLDVSGFNTAIVRCMNGMFLRCSGLKSLNVFGFDISQLASLHAVDENEDEALHDDAGIFESCTSLKFLDLSSFDFSKFSAKDLGFKMILSGCRLQELRTPKALPAGCSIPLEYTYQTTSGTTTTAITPELVSTTLKLVQVTPAPARFTVAGVVGGRNVTFKSDTQGAVIYYSTKTGNITTNDTCVQNGETVLFENFYGTVYARPYLNGVWGNVSKLILKIPVVNKPVITVKGSEVSIKTTTGACTIYYTTDGSTPSPTNGKKLTKSAGSFTVEGSCTVKAIAVRSCFTNSAVASAQVKVSDTRPGAPSFGVKGVIGGREVTFNSKDSKAEIYYSFTTSNITTKDKHVKAGEKVLFENYYGTVYAKAYLNGKWSNVSRLVLKIPTVNTPSITSAGNGKVKITTTTPNCIIYYTTDGSTPSPTNGRRVNSSSTVISVGAGATVKAIAVRSCFTNSKVVTYKK